MLVWELNCCSTTQSRNASLSVIHSVYMRRSVDLLFLWTCFAFCGCSAAFVCQLPGSDNVPFVCCWATAIFPPLQRWIPPAVPESERKASSRFICIRAFHSRPILIAVASQVTFCGHSIFLIKNGLYIQTDATLCLGSLIKAVEDMVEFPKKPRMDFPLTNKALILV